MTCQFSPCNCCNRFLKSTAVTITGTSPNQVVTITIPTTTLENLEDYCLVIAQSLPVGSNALPVVVLNGTTSIPLRCRKGNNVHADQINTRCKYSVTYGNDPIHFTINNGILKSCFTE